MEFYYSCLCSAVLAVLVGRKAVGCWCPRDWTPNRDSCYVISKKAPASWVTWWCRKQGGNLVSIKDEEENHFLEKLTGGKPNHWIGLTFDASARNWKWYDGTGVRYTKWDGKKAPRGRGGLCIRLKRGGRWKTKPCNKNLQGICEKPAAETPTLPAVTSERHEIALTTVAQLFHSPTDKETASVITTESREDDLGLTQTTAQKNEGTSHDEGTSHGQTSVRELYSEPPFVLETVPKQIQGTGTVIPETRTPEETRDFIGLHDVTSARTPTAVALSHSVSTVNDTTSVSTLSSVDTMTTQQLFDKVTTKRVPDRDDITTEHNDTRGTPQTTSKLHATVTSFKETGLTEVMATGKSIFDDFTGHTTTLQRGAMLTATADSLPASIDISTTQGKRFGDVTTATVLNGDDTTIKHEDFTDTSKKTHRPVADKTTLKETSELVEVMTTRTSTSDDLIVHQTNSGLNTTVSERPSAAPSTSVTLSTLAQDTLSENKGGSSKAKDIWLPVVLTTSMLCLLGAICLVVLLCNPRFGLPHGTHEVNGLGPVWSNGRDVLFLGTSDPTNPKSRSLVSRDSWIALDVDHSVADSDRDPSLNLNEAVVEDSGRAYSRQPGDLDEGETQEGQYIELVEGQSGKHNKEDRMRSGQESHSIAMTSLRATSI